MPEASPARGNIFDIQRFSIHDGPGIRTTVFFKGCPLRCPWCHNPEGLEAAPSLFFRSEKCIGCGYCFKACPRNAHRAGESGEHSLDRVACERCGSCARECHADALEMAGRSATVDEIISLVARDRVFYATSGGGLTLSGGEPLAQPDFALALLQAAKEQQIHTALETCGHAPFEVFEKILPCVDFIIFDLKCADPQRHLEMTGVSNDLILANARRLAALRRIQLIRIPWIAGLNTDAASLESAIALLKSLAVPPPEELMRYHALGESNRAALGMEPAALPRLEDDAILEILKTWREAFSGAGISLKVTG